MKSPTRRVGLSLALVFAAVSGEAAFADELVAEPAALPPHVDVDELPDLPPATVSGAAAAATVTAAIDAAEDVVVGAAKREQSLGNVASAVTVVSADRIRRFGYRTVAEALRAVAGVYFGDDRITERIGIRGLSVLGSFNSRVLVLVDGLTINEPWGQYAGLGRDAPVGIDEIARIEVIRGPVSSVYGTNAFLGIINIVTRGAAETPRAWARLGGSTFRAGDLAAGFSAGTVDRQIRGSVSGVLREGEHLSAEGIGDNLGSDGIRALTVGVVATWDGAFGQARFVRRARDNPFAPFGAAPGLDSYTEYDTLGIVELGITREVSKRLTLTGRTYGAAYGFLDGVLTAADAPLFRAVGQAKWAGVELRARGELIDRDRLGITVGGEATLVHTVSRAYNQGSPDTINLPLNFDTEGLYVEADSAPRPWLGLTVGLRADRNSKLEDRLSPRAALFLSKKDRYGAKFLYAEGFRNPSAFEGFFADGEDFIANPNIGAETIRSFEVVGWVRPRPGISLRLSGFRWDAAGIVEQELVGTVLQFQNVGSLRSTGVEFEGSFRDRHGWYAFGGATVAAARAPGSDDPDRVASAPAVSGSAGISTPKLWGHAHVSTEVVLVGPRPTRFAAIDTRSFVGWNLVVYAPEVFGFDITVGARNLLGRREQIPAQEDYDRPEPPGTDVPYLPGEGREFFVRVGRAL